MCFFYEVRLKTSTFYFFFVMMQWILCRVCTSRRQNDRASERWFPVQSILGCAGPNANPKLTPHVQRTKNPNEYGVGSAQADVTMSLFMYNGSQPNPSWVVQTLTLTLTLTVNLMSGLLTALTKTVLSMYTGG